METIKIDDDFFIVVSHIAAIKIINDGPCVQFTMDYGDIITKCYTSKNKLSRIMYKLNVVNI